MQLSIANQVRIANNTIPFKSSLTTECTKTIMQALQCEEGDLRLAEGSINHGRVEICVNETWGTICSTNWGQSETTVACRQLGFSENGTIYNVIIIWDTRDQNHQWNKVTTLNTHHMQMLGHIILDLEIDHYTTVASYVVEGNFG